MNNELKPCPFCGGVKLRIIRDQLDVMLGVEGSVLCPCGVKIPVNKWNTRIEDKQLAAANAEIVELVKHLSLMTNFYRIDLLDHGDVPSEDACYSSALKVIAKHKGSLK